MVKSSLDNVDKFTSPIKTCGDETYERPVSPMANLKLLLSVLSPDIKIREEYLKQHQNTGRLVSADSTGEYEVTSDKKEISSSCNERINKSLRLICIRIINKYPSFPIEITTICLKQLSKDLDVGARRLYDVVNILEAIGVVQKCCKNEYEWFGKKKLEATLYTIKEMAMGEDFVRNILLSSAVEFDDEFHSILAQQVVSNYRSITLPRTKRILSEHTSLFNMSQRFLVLLIILKNKCIALDEIAQLMFYGENIHQSMKSTTRRLYDIANVLLTFGLLEKVHLKNSTYKKTTFKYIGPSVRLKTENPAYYIDHDYTYHSAIGHENERGSIFSVVCETSKSSKRIYCYNDTKESTMSMKKSKNHPRALDFTCFDNGTKSSDDPETASLTDDSQNNRVFNGKKVEISDISKVSDKCPFTSICPNLPLKKKLECIEINPYDIPSLLTPSPSPVSEREAKPAVGKAVMNWKLHLSANKPEKENDLILHKRLSSRQKKVPLRLCTE